MSVISIFHTVPLGKMHYRDLERVKVSFLKDESGNFEVKIALNQHIVTELQWRLDAIPKAVSDIHTPEVDFIINADVSESGWGATDRLGQAKWKNMVRTLQGIPYKLFRIKR